MIGRYGRLKRVCRAVVMISNDGLGLRLVSLFCSVTAAGARLSGGYPGVCATGIYYIGFFLFLWCNSVNICKLAIT